MSADMQPYQILCLEHENMVLYGEVIQIIPERKLYWLRPLALLQRTLEDPETILALHDLRQGADLLYPQALFRAALDLEVIPVLMQLELLKQGATSDSDSTKMARQHLQSFIYCIWQSQPEAFHSL
jgi:hypothetical protein